MAEAYIVSATRTAGGRRDGRLKDWHPADMAGEVLKSVISKANADPERVDDVIMGCVGQAGEQAGNIARNAVLSAGMPESVPATSVDRQCGSSQQALHFAAQAVMSGFMDCVIASGVESMTRVPMGLPMSLPAKNGFGFYVSPHMTERYPDVQFSQFAGAEMMAKKYDLSKDELDEFGFAVTRRRSLRHRQEISTTKSSVLKWSLKTVPKKSTRLTKASALMPALKVFRA